jgi:hypothetical protein
LQLKKLLLASRKATTVAWVIEPGVSTAFREEKPVDDWSTYGTFGTFTPPAVGS